jgi:hypothetical protein
LALDFNAAPGCLSVKQDKPGTCYRYILRSSRQAFNPRASVLPHLP